MDENYRNYMTYVLGKNKDIEDVLLPFNQRINKYDFISLVSRIFSFNEPDQYPFHSIKNIFNKVIVDRSCDNEIAKLCNTVMEQIENGKRNYDTLSDVLIKMSIIFENNYLSIDDEIITYKTASCNIEDALYIIEIQSKMKGIVCHGFTEQKTYNFKLSMTNIINNLQKHCVDYHSLDPKLQRLHAFSTLNNESDIIYLEILLLVANTYNTSLRELYRNEW